MELFTRILITCICIWCIFEWATAPISLPTPAGKLCDYAKMSTYPLGCMDSRTMESIYRWTYGILVQCYYKDRYEEAVDIVLLWVNTQNDATGCIHLGCDQALLRISSTLDKHAEHPDDFQLTCNPDFNYHMLPSTMQYNDYMNCEDLIQKIDELLEV